MSVRSSIGLVAVRGGACARAALLGGALLLVGCSMKTLAHPMSAFDRAPKAAAAAPPSKPQEIASEQAVLAPHEPYWPYRQAQLDLASDSLGPAERDLSAALARDPLYPPALSLLSKLYFQTGRHAEAVKLLEEARSQSVRSPEGFAPALLADLALHYDALGRHDLAEQVVRGMSRAERERAGSASVYLLLRGDHPDSAADLATEAAHDQPRSAASQNNYGIARLRAGDPDEAERAFRKAIDLDPKLAGPYYNLTILEKFYRLDDAAAAQWFARYRERASDDPDGLAQAFGKSEAKEMAEKKE